MTAKQRLQRLEFLTNWFVEIVDGVKPPYTNKQFKGIVGMMKTTLAAGGQFKEKYKEKS